MPPPFPARRSYKSATFNRLFLLSWRAGTLDSPTPTLPLPPSLPPSPIPGPKKMEKRPLDSMFIHRSWRLIDGVISRWRHQINQLIETGHGSAMESHQNRFKEPYLSYLSDLSDLSDLSLLLLCIGDARGQWTQATLNDAHKKKREEEEEEYKKKKKNAIDAGGGSVWPALATTPLRRLQDAPSRRLLRPSLPPSSSQIAQPITSNHRKSLGLLALLLASLRRCPSSSLLLPPPGATLHPPVGPILKQLPKMARFIHRFLEINRRRFVPFDGRFHFLPRNAFNF